MIDALLGTATTTTRVARGRVAVAPTSHTTSLSVTLLNYSAEFAYEIPAGQWAARGAGLPAVNDETLVVFDDDGDAWACVWGVTYVAPSTGGGGGDPIPPGTYAPLVDGRVPLIHLPMYVQPTEPADVPDGTLWFDTSGV